MSATEQPSPAPPWLRYHPVGVGDLMDRSLSLLRRHFGTLFALSLILQLVEYAVAAWMGEGVTLSSQLLQLQQSFTDLTDRSTWGGLVLVQLAFVIGQVNLGVAALVTFLDVEARPLNLRAVSRRLLNRLPSLLWTVFVLGAVYGGILAAASMAVVALAGLSVALGPIAGGLLVMAGVSVAAGVGSLLLLRLALTPVVATLEPVSGVRALRRSMRLISRRQGRGWRHNNDLRMGLIFTVVMLSTWGVTALAALPGLLLAGLAGAGTGDLAGSWLHVVLELLEVTGRAAVGPFGSLAMAAFYFDLRARHEGLDLQYAARFLAQRRGVA
ncbi:MAG: hypothetical protein ABIJ09_09880 [Pseudomonadota bacterium]